MLVSEAGLDELRREVAGGVITPADAGYDAARRCFNALIDRRPALIVRCRSPRDVGTAFGFARAERLNVAVRGAGHNPAGHCVLDGGLVIDLSQMRRVDVDARDRTARVQGGSTWLDFDAATQAHGLVTPGGVVGSTGVCGLTLGGGIGHLTAQLGLTCDNLVGAELVMPDGSMVCADGDHADLLWGLRGGGGNFGVVTEFEFRLHPLTRVLGGVLGFAGDVRGVLRRFCDVSAESPRELSWQAELGVNDSLEPTLEIAVCYTGDENAPAPLETLRSLPGLRTDGLRVHSFLDQQRLLDSPYGENRHYWKGHFVRDLPDELIDDLIARLRALGRPPGHVLVESLHGAAREVDPASAAAGFRHAAFNVSVMSVWRDPAQDAEQIAWARETAAGLEPRSVSSGYVNYMQGDEPIERVQAAFGDEAFARLRALKRRYDPGNVLSRNQNVPPAEVEAGHGG